MKILAWISGILAAIAILFGFLRGLGVGEFLWVENGINWIHLATALLLFTIVFKMCEKEE